jgi:aryl-alcohol dehydrogenase-like predicted oxidoreductase
MLTGQYRKPSDFPENDFRRTIPRFSEENFPKNLRIGDEFQKLAAKKGCTAAQLALAWVIRQGAIPIPGTKTASRLAENWAATDIDLTDEEEAELRKLINDAKPVGDR